MKFLECFSTERERTSWVYLVCSNVKTFFFFFDSSSLKNKIIVNHSNRYNIIALPRHSNAVLHYVLPVILHVSSEYRLRVTCSVYITRTFLVHLVVATGCDRSRTLNSFFLPFTSVRDTSGRRRR